MLQDWKKKFAPQTPQEEPHEHYVEACHMLECTQYMVDQLTIGSPKERTKLVGDIEEMVLCDKEKQAVLPPENTLAGCEVRTGSCLILV